MDYTRRDLAQAVLDAHPDSRRGLDMFRGAFSEVMKLNEQSREAHLDVADELIVLISPTVDTMTSADLLALGVDDTPPNSSDYESDC